VLDVPQTGDIVFAAAADGTIVGRTDQGYTWRFAHQGDSLKLSPPSQFCFNHVIGSSYTITDWSVEVSGRHERESLTAISHLPTGDYQFQLSTGPAHGSPGHRRFRHVQALHRSLAL
jgi:hypothetical protein